MENEVILKRAIFGGFDRRQVMEYIAYLHSKSNTVKSELAELAELKLTVAELEAELFEKDNTIDRLHREVKEAEGHTRLNRASSALMKESVAYADCYIESAKVIARDISDKTNTCVDEAKDRIEDIMDSIGDISDSILDLYSSVDNLLTEYDNFGDIYPEAKFDIAVPPISKFEEEAEKTESETAKPAEESVPAEESMTQFLRRMEEKYRNMLNS